MAEHLVSFKDAEVVRDEFKVLKGLEIEFTKISAR